MPVSSVSADVVVVVVVVGAAAAFVVVQSSVLSVELAFDVVEDVVVLRVVLLSRQVIGTSVDEARIKHKNSLDFIFECFGL